MSKDNQPALVDVDASFSLDPDDLEQKITERSKAVVMVHVRGVVGQITRVAEICQKNGLLLLEDCALEENRWAKGIHPGGIYKNLRGVKF